MPGVQFCEFLTFGLKGPDLGQWLISLFLSHYSTVLNNNSPTSTNGSELRSSTLSSLTPNGPGGGGGRRGGGWDWTATTPVTLTWMSVDVCGRAVPCAPSNSDRLSTFGRSSHGPSGVFSFLWGEKNDEPTVRYDHRTLFTGGLPRTVGRKQE